LYATEALLRVLIVAEVMFKDTGEAAMKTGSMV
jgi:hypothetical protein